MDKARILIQAKFLATTLTRAGSGDGEVGSNVSNG